MTLKILIVDDRGDVRRTLREMIELNLPQEGDIEVDDIFPLDDVDSYASFIREHDFAALLLDERLNESKNPVTGTHIPYFGHDVVGALRSALPDFPVYIVTTFQRDTDLVAKESEVEDVVDRGDFQRDAQKYTSRIQRAASRFQDAMRQQLSLLDDLTVKAAHGELTADEGAKLKGIRQALGLPFSGDSHLVASDMIAKARRLLVDTAGLVEKLKSDESK